MLFLASLILGGLLYGTGSMLGDQYALRIAEFILAIPFWAYIVHIGPAHALVWCDKRNTPGGYFWAFIQGLNCFFLLPVVYYNARFVRHDSFILCLFACVAVYYTTLVFMWLIGYSIESFYNYQDTKDIETEEDIIEKLKAIYTPDFLKYRKEEYNEYFKG